MMKTTDPKHRKDYIRWYSQSDLDAPASRHITAMTVWSLAMIVAFLLIAMTLAFWIRKVQEARLAASPLAKSLWIGQPGNERAVLTGDALKMLHEKILSEKPSNPPEPIQRFSRIPMKFQCESESDGFQEWYGRTVELGDPILLRLNGGREIPPDLLGVVPTRELLNHLRFSTCEDPTELWMRFSNEHPGMRVPVLFVADVKLPYNLKFLLRRCDLNTLDAKVNDASAESMKLGPITEDWPNYRELKRDEEMPDICLRLGIDVPKFQGSEGEGYYYLVEPSDGEPKKINLWNQTAKQLRNELIEYMRVVRPDVDRRPDALGEIALVDEIAPPSRPVVFDLAEVRVLELTDLKATARGCRNAGFPADETLVSQVDQVYQVGRMLLLAMLSTCVSLLLIAGIMMFVIQRLRCELKVPEIGMLKAVGISGVAFRELFQIQATTFWLRSMLRGAGIGLFAVVVISLFTANSQKELLLLAYTFFKSVAVLGCITFIVIRFSLLQATKKARLADPMDTIM